MSDRKEKKEKKEKKHKRERDEDDEDAQRRANKKAAKRAEKVAKMLGYTNDTNPFGDSNLLQPFVWGKKVDKDMREGREVEDSDMQRLKTMEEIERVRKRREDREKEMEEMERLRTEEQRLRDSAQYGDWQAKEEDFHMEQTKARSKIRITEAREQPIDSIAKNILLIESHLQASSGKKQEYDLAGLGGELRDPSRVMNGLGAEELEKLLQDIEAYLQLEVKKSGPYEAFWRALKSVADAERRQLVGSASSVHKSVQDDVKQLFRGKTATDLKKLQGEIEAGIAAGTYADVEYWQETLQAVGVQQARLVLTDTHHALLQKQLEVISRLQTGENAPGAGGGGKEGRGGGEGDDYEREFGESEEKMGGSDEVALPASAYSWQDKFRPRKPRYFNRVKTGWDWNKYNQTHYDHDNPPPRSVQGYKFTVFYPDLIDKSVTPKYFVEACAEKEFAILRFHAGPPYEDVAFKILNREWHISSRSGFRCTFDRGVLQLHFNYKVRIPPPPPRLLPPPPTLAFLTLPSLPSTLLCIFQRAFYRR